jgi:hypothetical protein
MTQAKLTFSAVFHRYSRQEEGPLPQFQQNIPHLILFTGMPNTPDRQTGYQEPQGENFSYPSKIIGGRTARCGTSQTTSCGPSVPKQSDRRATGTGGS